MPTKKHLQLNLILLGDPGAGKATQAEYFSKKYNLYDFDMGRELTLLRQKDKRVEQAQAKTADKGNLTPTKIVRGVIRDTFDKLPDSKGILFDGHPKMLGEAKLVTKLLKETGRTKPLVLYLSITMAEMVARVQNRKGYHNTKFSQRKDDNKAALNNRMRYYRTNIVSVIDYFKDTYTFAKIDGMGTRAQVRSRIQKAITFYLKNYDEINK